MESLQPLEGEEVTPRCGRLVYPHRLTITVPGIPAPGGSKRAFYNRAARKIVVTEDSKRNKPWRERVALAAAEQYQKAPLTCPLHVAFVFTLPRPKGHFGTGRNAGTVRTSAPEFPAGKPDVLKLARAAEDALTGILWRDDAQIVLEYLAKEYGENPGLRVIVTPLERDMGLPR